MSIEQNNAIVRRHYDDEGDKVVTHQDATLEPMSCVILCKNRSLLLTATVE